MPENTVTIGEQTFRVERVSARKASRAFKLLRKITAAVPELSSKWAEADARWRAENVERLDRGAARLRFPARPLIAPLADGTLVPMKEPDQIPGPDGGLVDNPRAGELVMSPSPLDSMSEEDWQAVGNVLTVEMPPPNNGPMIAAVFPEALDVAEQEVMRLLALFLLTNDEVTRFVKEDRLDDELTVKADWILDTAFGDEVLEVAVVCGEVIDHQFRRKAAELGDRMGNAWRLFGRGPKQPTTNATPPTSSTPTSSTDSPANTGGDPTPPSTVPMPSSSPSSNEPTTTPTDGELSPLNAT